MANKLSWNRCTSCSWMEVPSTPRNPTHPTKGTLGSSFWLATCIDSAELQNALVSHSISSPFIQNLLHLMYFILQAYCMPFLRNEKQVLKLISNFSSLSFFTIFSQFENAVHKICVEICKLNSHQNKTFSVEI